MLLMSIIIMHIQALTSVTADMLTAYTDYELMCYVPINHNPSPCYCIKHSLSRVASHENGM
jgi:hypothetical protein